MNDPIDVYNLSALLYEELKKRHWPDNSIINLNQPWVEMSESYQQVWEEAVKRALIRGGVVEGDAGQDGYTFHRPRQFRKQKEGET